MTKQRKHNTGLAKVAVRFSADIPIAIGIMVAKSSVLHISISGKIATLAKPQTVMRSTQKLIQLWL